MVYQLKPDPRDTAARRLPGLRELQQQKPIYIQKDKLPPKLGARTRSMTLLMSVLGLATFAVPLITTSIPVAGRTQWSPLLILEGLLGGSLPSAAANLPPEAYHYLYELIAIDTILFGTMFAYAALIVILVSALRQATRFVIGAAASFGMLAALLEMRGYADLQLALLGGTPEQRGAHVVGFTYCGVLFIVMLLVLLVVTIKELEGIPS